LLTAAAQDASENGAEPIGDVHIRVERDGDVLTIIPTYALPDTAAVTAGHRYELTVERTGASTARSRQGGPFTPTPGRVDTLSTVRVNAQPGDRVHLRLVVRRNDRIIADLARTEDISPPE
jgi:hypothetical protein